MNFTEDEEIEIAHSTHAGMLHDDERHEKYYEALKLVVQELKENSSKSIHALDIGCGTGILSMMAAKSGCDHVTACEAFKPMVSVASKVIKSNELSAKITVIGKTSSEVSIPQDMAGKVDLLVTEIFDSELIGEGVLPTLRDAHERLLHSHCKVVPCSADINIQLIQSDWLWQTNKINFDWLSVSYPKTFDECRGYAAAHEVQIDQLYPNNIQLLSNAHKQTSFSFTEPFHHNVLHNGSKYSFSKTNIKITRSGILHGVLFWWDLILHEKANIILSIKPQWMKKNNEEITWREHWMQAVYYLPKSLEVDVNDTLSVTMYHDDYSIWFDVSKDFSDSHLNHDYVDRPLCSCGLHITCPREKFALLNDPSMHNFFKNVIFRFERYKNSSVTILGDMSILPLLFSKHGFRNLKYVECNPFSKYTMRELFKSDEIVQKIGITDIQSFDRSNVDGFVICEPYFASSLLPWQHLRIWHHLHEIRVENSSTVKLFPIKAILRGCLVSFQDLWRIREPVRNINGFHLNEYDTLIEHVLSPLEVEGHGCFQAVEPFLMWEYKHKIVSDVFVLKEFNLQEPIFDEIVSISGCVNTIPDSMNKDNAVVSKTHLFNAIVLWMDYEIDAGLYFYTGLNEQNKWVCYSKQGVYFIGSKTLQQEKQLLDFKVLFNPEDYDILFDFTIRK